MQTGRGKHYSVNLDSLLKPFPGIISLTHTPTMASSTRLLVKLESYELSAIRFLSSLLKSPFGAEICRLLGHSLTSLIQTGLCIDALVHHHPDERVKRKSTIS
jgi:hypothetical protein